MEQISEKIISTLQAAGIEAKPRFDAGKLPRLQQVMAAVEVQSLRCLHSGLGEYLGTLEVENGGVAECYGRRVCGTALVRLYAPTAQMVLQGAQEAAKILENGVVGLRPEELSLGETNFDDRCDLFWRDLLLQFSGYFYVLSQEDGQYFCDFELEGEIQ